MSTIGTPLFWSLFLFGVVVLLVLDLTVVHREAHVVRAREALRWTLLCVTLAGLFAGWLFWEFGTRVGLEFVTGYLIEYALSIDNLFVFLVVFSYFGVPQMHRHRVLFWGILGALVMRALFIVTGATLLARFEWMTYLFGGFLIVTGVKLAIAGETQVEPARNPFLRLVRRLLPVTETYHRQRFLVRLDGKLYATPLLLVLVVIESTDVVFAVDSIPAIFAVTRDPFIVFTSNIFAILGLRALFFLLADFMNRFHYLGLGLGVVLAFVGAKMVAAAWFHVPIGVSLAIIATILGAAVAFSLLLPPPAREGGDQPR